MELKKHIQAKRKLVCSWTISIVVKLGDLQDWSALIHRLEVGIEEDFITFGSCVERISAGC